jgi:hypothetical protein
MDAGLVTISVVGICTLLVCDEFSLGSGDWFNAFAFLSLTHTTLCGYWHASPP